jgi:hypothetical protein
MCRHNCDFGEVEVPRVRVTEVRATENGTENAPRLEIVYRTKQ